MSQTPPPVIQYAHAQPGRVLFSSPGNRAQKAFWAIAAVLVMNLVVGASSLMQRQLLVRMVNGEQISTQEADANNQRQTVIGLVNSAVAIAAVVAFLMWVHRVYRNLGAFPGVTMRWTPGWVVGYYFIPIMNLFRPYQSMRDVWDASQPWNAPADEVKLVDWWWGTYILTIVINLAVTITLTARALGDAERMLAQTNAEIVSNLLGFIPGIFVLLMIRKITERQSAKAMEGGPGEGMAVASVYQPPIAGQ